MEAFYWQRHPGGPFATLIRIAATCLHPGADDLESLRRLARREDDGEMRVFKDELRRAVDDPGLVPGGELSRHVQYEDGSPGAFVRRLWRDLYGGGQAFAIELRTQREAGEKDGGPAEASGTIVIGDFTETFRVPLGFWDESGYRRSWRQAFDVLDSDPHATSCLVTSMTDPASSNFLVCWPMYRDGEHVYVQNAIIFPGQAGEGFDSAAPWGCLEPRRGTDEDGNKVSEWTTSMDSLREFFSPDEPGRIIR